MRSFCLSLILSCLVIFPITCSASFLSWTSAKYYPDYEVQNPPVTAAEVAFYKTPPTSACLKIGVIHVNGNGHSGIEDLIKKAKKKAAELGVDYVLLEESGVKSKTIVIPGSSTYQSGASWQKGYGDYYSSGDSTGPTVVNHDFPWAIFSVWVQLPSNLGIKLDGLHVCGFVLNSPAENSELAIGDELIGIDGFDVNDHGLIYHLLEIRPGDSVTVSVRRDGRRQDFSIKAMKNM